MRAWHGISFDPEKLGKSQYEYYTEELQKDLEVVEDKQRYIETYTKYLYDWLYTESTCLSWFITGPANFPVARNQKRMDSARNKYLKFREVRTKILKASNRVNLDIYEELEQNKEQLKNLKERQQYYKDINKSKILKSGKDIPQELQEWISYGCIPTFEITSLRNKIKTKKQRIKDLEKKIYLKENVENETYKVTEDYTIIKNYEIDRLQILFNDRPDKDTIGLLKSCGFRWSPKNTAWQRQLTTNALWSLERFEAKYKEEV